MYIFEIRYKNAFHNGCGSLQPGLQEDVLKKWTFIDSTSSKKDTEFLQLTALAGIGCAEFLNHLPYPLTRLIGDPGQPLQVEMVWVEHNARKGEVFEKPRRHSGLKIMPAGKGVPLSSRDKRLLHEDIPRATSSKWNHPAKHTVFAYGSTLTAHAGSDDFNFSDPFYQLKRIKSLFNTEARLTDPAAFLQNLHHRGIRCGRYMPAQILQTLQTLTQRWLNANLTIWTDKYIDFTHQWAELSPQKRFLILPALDAARHLHDALPSFSNPLHFPGIMLLNRPDQYCPPYFFTDWINFLDRLFPAMQFVVVMPASLKALLPEAVPGKVLPRFAASREASPGTQHPASAPAHAHANTDAHADADASAPAKPAGLPPGTVLLVDVDSRLPNLALMKLAGYYKQRGYQIRLAKKEAYESGAEAVFASSIFNNPTSGKRVQKMKTFYGDVFHCGGSGLDIEKRLPREIEEGEADYGLYPALEDRAIGFLTRGCPFNCPFCIVPLKEGKPRQVAGLSDLVGPDRKKLILLDDNILAHPNRLELLQEIAAKNIRVNFNQTLDLKLADKDTAGLLRAIHCSNVKFTRTVYHFSLNDACNLSELRKKYDLFNFSPADNVEFICMYGFNTTLAEDLERFRFLRSLPGAYVFTQEYQPVAETVQPCLDGYFPEQSQADCCIDELVKICFPQNMKSMEKYYHWLSRLYAERFGTLHTGLVDTIFRYNKRFNRGRYIASLAGTKQIY